MPGSGQTRIPKGEGVKKKRSSSEQPTGLSTKEKEKLDALDAFIGEVLEEAGEDFLEKFKQVEGE
jgi:hypothetical protein